MKKLGEKEIGQLKKLKQIHKSSTGASTSSQNLLLKDICEYHTDVAKLQSKFDNLSLNKNGLNSNLKDNTKPPLFQNSN